MVNRSKQVLTFLASLALSCLDATEERAVRDEQIGHVALDTGRIDVDGGLAHVRASSAGDLTLWMQAPAADLTLTPGAGSPSVWKIHLQNTLSDIQLTGTDAAGAALTIERQEDPLPTRRTFTVHLPARGAARLRLAPPDADAPGKYRFGVLSDVQEAIDRVGDIYQKINATPDVRFVLGIGDLTQRGTIAELERFQRELEALHVPYFATLGNHELGTEGTYFHDYYGRGNFHFVFRGVHYSLLDSASATLDPRVYDWLDGWLAEGRHGTHIVGMHIPPIDPVGVRNGAFASRPEATKLLSRLIEGQVDLTLYGHIHTYFPFANGGIPAYISGGGGAIPERMDGIGRHFLVIDLDATGVEHVGLVRVD